MEKKPSKLTQIHIHVELSEQSDVVYVNFAELPSIVYSAAQRKSTLEISCVSVKRFISSLA